MGMDILKIIANLLLVWSGSIGFLTAVAIAVTLCITIFHFTLEKTFFKFWNWIKDDTSFGNWIKKEIKKENLLLGILGFIVFITLMIYSDGIIIYLIFLVGFLSLPWYFFFGDSSNLKKLTSFFKKAGIALIVSFLINYLSLVLTSFFNGDEIQLEALLDGDLNILDADTHMSSGMYFLYIIIPVVVILIINWLIEQIMKYLINMYDNIRRQQAKKEAEQEKKEIE